MPLIRDGAVGFKLLLRYREESDILVVFTSQSEKRNKTIRLYADTIFRHIRS